MNLETQDRKEAVLARMGGMGFSALSLDEERIRVKWKTLDWNDVFLVHFYKTRPVYNPVTHYASFSVFEDKKTESVNISDLGSGWEKARVAITACAILRQVSVDGAIAQMSIIDNIPRRSSKWDCHRTMAKPRANGTSRSKDCSIRSRRK